MILVCNQNGEPLLPGRWVDMRLGGCWDHSYLTVPDIHFQGSSLQPNPGRYLEVLFGSNTLM